MDLHCIRCRRVNTETCTLPTPYMLRHAYIPILSILVQRPLCMPPALLHIRYMKYTVQHILPAHEQAMPPCSAGSIEYSFLKGQKNVSRIQMHTHAHTCTHMPTHAHIPIYMLISPLVTPSSLPQPTTTCDALNTIQASGQGCSVTSSCDEVDCTLLGYSTGFIVLPCNTPPAVGIIVNDTRNNTLFNQVISQSQQIPLFGVTTLDITVVQLTNALGLKVRCSNYQYRL